MKKLNEQFLHSPVVARLRLLTGLLLGVAGVFLALFATARPGLGIARTQRQNNIIISSTDPLVPVGFDCSTIGQLGIDKQTNLRAAAIMIACGATPGGEELVLDSPSQATIEQPAMFGTADVDLITGTETSPNITQSTTFAAGNPDNPLQIVIGYNDSRGRNASPINVSGASVSTDGGNTFTRLTRASGQSPFDNTFGDPVVLYSKPSSTWFTVWLDGTCGTDGLGGYKSSTPSDPNSWTHFCIHNGSGDDRESGWADNNPSSPFLGRMYVSWNDFSLPNANIFSTFSTDNGITWHSPVMVSTQATLIRNVQMTGDLVTGDVYIAGMDEGGGGFPHNDTNLLFKSTDGGNTWANTYTGPPFPGPGVTAVGFFACMFSDGGGYWRHEGWGQPAAFNHVVSLVYAEHGTASDPGDVYYIRSTDGGVTFSAPLKLNTDATTRPQWEPNLSVSNAGTLFATWYDARESASCTAGNPNVPCYRMWSRKSTDNGVTWLADDTFSDVVSPLPAQPDPGIGATVVSDYDYASSNLNLHLSGWVDGRVSINGASQQDAFADREGRASPMISTTASGPTNVGGNISDTATISGGSNPTGSVTFKLYGPNDSMCGNTPVFTSTVTVNGNGSYISGSFITTAAGTYHWIASYSGDANNNAVSGSCGDMGESVVVSKLTPTLSTLASPNTTHLGATVTDTATVSGGFSPTGTVTFQLFGPNQSTCGGAPVFTSTNALSGGSATSNPFVPTISGTYRWIASYNGDANNNPVAGTCNAANESVVVLSAATSVTGSGTIDSPFGGSASFIVNAQFKHGGPKVSGNIDYSDPNAGFRLTQMKITSMVFTGDCVHITGTARLGMRTRVSFIVDACDIAPPGTDSFAISLSNGYSASGNLTSGQITFH